MLNGKRSPSNTAHSLRSAPSRSSPINLEDIGVVFVRLKRSTPEGGSAVDLIRAEIAIESSTIFVILSKSDEWPFEIENDTDYAFTFSQKVRNGLVYAPLD